MKLKVQQQNEETFLCKCFFFTMGIGRWRDLVRRPPMDIVIIFLLKGFTPHFVLTIIISPSSSSSHRYNTIVGLLQIQSGESDEMHTICDTLDSQIMQ